MLSTSELVELGAGMDDHHTLRRGIAVLSYLAIHDSLSVTEVASLISCDKSQASRVLKVLSQYGLVARDRRSRRYRLGWLVYGLALRVSGRQVLSIAGPVVRTLSAKVGEGTWLAVLSGSEVLTVHTARERDGAFRSNELAGNMVPAYCTASGRALLSGLDDDDVESLLDSVEIRRRGSNSPVDKADVLARLANDRRAGYSVARDELEDGLISVGAPVFDSVGYPVMSIGFSAAAARVLPDLDKFALEVVTASKHLRSQLVSAPSGWGSLSGESAR